MVLLPAPLGPSRATTSPSWILKEMFSTAAKVPKYFDRFPLDSVKLPVVPDDDLADVPSVGRRMAKPERDHARVIQHGQWRPAVQGYLASISFVDTCLGRVLDALDRSPYRDNTIVVLWSDHGWHLGEKMHWRKFALWEEATRIVMMWSVRFWLIQSIIVARVVVFPEPVGPVTNTIPCGLRMMSRNWTNVFDPKPITSRSSITTERSRIRITTLSPNIVGNRLTRRSTGWPPTASRMRPSCGSRRSAMSRSAITLTRVVIAIAKCRGGGTIS